MAKKLLDRSTEEEFKKVGDIIRSDKSRRYVVPSAPGKRNDKDEKVTDLLYECYDAAASGSAYKKILEKIKKRYEEIIDGLDLNLNLDHEFDKIEENFLAKAGSSLLVVSSLSASSLMSMAYLSQRLPTRNWLRDWSMWREPLSQASMVPSMTVLLRHFPEVVLM